MKWGWKVLICLFALYLVGWVLLSRDSQVEAMREQVTSEMEKSLVEVSEPVIPHLSVAARDLPRLEQLPRLEREINPLRNPYHLSPDLGRKGSDTKSIDPLLGLSHVDTGQTPDPILNFEGLGTDGFAPPDTVGDVGPNHYVQMVNVSFQIYNKSGNVLLGDTSINALFNGTGGVCEGRNDGDPIVIYDDMADRWVLSQFADIFNSMTMCFAVSQTPDPTGAYYLYEFNGLPDVPDYFKFGVWSDGYYMSTNSGSPNAYYAHVFDRERMLTGEAATRQSVGDHPNFMMPADADGSMPPPAGAPNYFYTFFAEGYANHPLGGDRLALYEFHVDWDTPGNSTFALTQEIPIADYNYTVCGFFVGECIPQPDTGQRLDSLSYWPMWRFQYRNFGNYEAAVGNFTVDVDGTDKAGIRWFELRKNDTQASASGGNWALYQEGTHAPDDDHRWMGSIAMDASGNIGLGYSVSSGSTYPSIRYATRLRDDPAGTLQAEATLIDGGGSQTATHRWGDYSALTVDPVDGCTFWYTTEYHPENDLGFNWHTRIGTFRLPECTGGIEPDFAMTVTPANQAVCAPDEASYEIEIGSMEGFSELVDLSVVDAPAGTTTTLSLNSVTPSVPPVTSTLTISDTDMVAAGSYSFDVVGEATSSSHAKSVGLEIFFDVPDTPMLVSPSDGAAAIELMPTFEWEAVAGVGAYLLEVATDAGFTDVVYSEMEDGTRYTLGSSLNYGTQYYWRVTAVNSCGESVASEIFSFTTVNAPQLLCHTSRLAIPDNAPSGISAIIDNPNMGNVLDVDISLKATHSWVGDLTLTVEHNGTNVTIVDRPGNLNTGFGCSGNDIDATLDDEADFAVEDQCRSDRPTINGRFIPNEALSAFDGMAVNGDWTITVSDHAEGDDGVLDEWCLMVISDGIQVESISPNYGLNDLPTSIYISGIGFSEPLSVTLGADALDVQYVTPNLIMALVPAGVEPGRYDLMVDAPAGSDTLAGSYEVLLAEGVDDLLASPHWLWTNPASMRVEIDKSKIGSFVQKIGGESTVDDVEVEFRLDSPDGELLGSSTTVALAPFDIQLTTPLMWEATEKEENTICAIIDPNDEVEETNEENNVTCRTITVLPFDTETTAPVVEEVTINDGMTSTSDFAITLDVTATHPTDAEIQALQFIEFEYMQSVQAWQMVQQSDWLPYASEGYPWMLMPAYGMHHIDVWAVDNKGNISSPPAQSLINVLPEEEAGDVAEEAVIFYRYALEAGETFSVTLTPVDGDPDLYVWGPDAQLVDYSDQITDTDHVSFEAESSGVYQIEVHGYTDAHYRLNFAAFTHATGWHSKLVGPKPVPEAPALPVDAQPLFFALDPPAVVYQQFLPVVFR